jgi:hypothetical protein
MLRSLQKSLSTPADALTVSILAGLALILGVTFLLAFQSFEIVAFGLILLAAGILLFLFFLPNSTASSITLMLLGLSVPFAHFALFVVVSNGFTAGHLLGTILMLHLAVRFLRGQRIQLTKAIYWLIFYVFAVFLSTVAILNRSPIFVDEFSKSILQLIFCVFLFFAVSQVKVRIPWINNLLKAMIYLSVGVALFGIYQLPARYFGLPGGEIRLYNPGLSGESQPINVYNVGRASSLFSEPSFFGHYLVGMLAMTITAALHRPNLFGKSWKLWLIIFIQITGLALSLSVGSFVTLAELLTIMLIVEKGRFRGRLITWLFSIFIIGTAALMTIQIFTEFHAVEFLVTRIGGIIGFLQGNTANILPGESLPQRIQVNQVGYRIWMDYPIIGVGFGCYTVLSPLYGETMRGGWAGNTLINTLAETGIVGFITLIGFFFTSLTDLWSIFRRKLRTIPEDLSKLGEIDMTRFVARMVFYLIVVEVLYSHISSLFLVPSLWLYLGIGALVTIQGEKAIREAISTSSR